MNAYSLMGLGCGCRGMGCNCQSPSVQMGVIDPTIGKYVSSPLAIRIFTQPGGAQVRTSTPNGYIGKVIGYNSARTWIQLLSGYWIINDKSYTYADGLTQFQRDDYAKNISSAPREQAEQLKQEIEDMPAPNQQEDGIFDRLLKKYGLPLILIGGSIYLAATYGRAFIQGKLMQPKTSLNGVDEFTLSDAKEYLKSKGKKSGRFYNNVFGWERYLTLKPTSHTPTGKEKGFPKTVIVKT